MQPVGVGDDLTHHCTSSGITAHNPSPFQKHETSLHTLPHHYTPPSPSSLCSRITAFPLASLHNPSKLTKAHDPQGLYFMQMTPSFHGGESHSIFVDHPLEELPFEHESNTQIVASSAIHI